MASVKSAPIINCNFYCSDLNLSRLSDCKICSRILRDLRVQETPLGEFKFLGQQEHHSGKKGTARSRAKIKKRNKNKPDLFLICDITAIADLLKYRQNKENIGEIWKTRAFKCVTSMHKKQQEGGSSSQCTEPRLSPLVYTCRSNSTASS